jgi:hypothetical protein
MSINFMIFYQSTVVPKAKFVNAICEINGVSYDPDADRIDIRGFYNAHWYRLDEEDKHVMLVSYGQFGLNVDSAVNCRLVDSSTILRDVETMYRCCAALINNYPNSNCSLMREGEDFYLHYSNGTLLISPIYTDAILAIKTIFKIKPVFESLKYN